jgi:hypothetical protein
MEEQDKLEYQETGQLFRQYTGFLLSIMQHFIAGNALFFLGLNFVSKEGAPISLTQIFVGLIGFFGCLGALIVQLRTFKYWKALLEHGENIEKKYGTNLYSIFHKTSHSKKVFRSAYFAIVLYLVFSFLWFIILLKLFGVSQIKIAI